MCSGSGRPNPQLDGGPDGSGVICELLHTRMSSPAVETGIHNPFAGEAYMTIQSLWTGPIVAGKDETRLSFWRRVVTAIAEGRQKKADAIVKQYLQRRAENQDSNKRWAPTPSRHGTR